MQTITVDEAQSRLAAILEALMPGQEVILTRGDKAVARLVAGVAEQPCPVRGAVKEC